LSRSSHSAGGAFQSMAIANDGLFGTILKKNPYIIKRINIKITIVSVSHKYTGVFYSMKSLKI